jgi:two-component system response regulator DevR
MNGKIIRVVIVDDHEVVREGIKSLLRDCGNIEVVGEISSIENAYQTISSLKPDVVLLDIRLGKADGLTLAKRIKINYQEAIKIIILSSYDDESYVNRSIRSHVDGYLLKSTSSDYLTEALENVMKGERVISPEIGNILFKTNQGDQSVGKLPLDEQDIKILELLAEGKNIAKIAETLSYSERTTKRKISAIVSSLDVKNRTEAVSKAIRLGLF